MRTLSCSSHVRLMYDPHTQNTNSSVIGTGPPSQRPNGKGVSFPGRWVGTATAVGAIKSFNGSDYSFQYGSGNSYMKTCDMESDSTKVKSKTDRDNQDHGEDAAEYVDGVSFKCATANMSYSIFRHRTCECRALWKGL